MQFNSTTVQPSTLADELRSLGYVEGAPPSVPSLCVAADVRIYRTMACGECGQRRQKVQPMHRKSEYRLLLTCRNPACRKQCEA